MPTYEYREQSGQIVTRVLPVERRDEFPGRITVPRRVMVCPRGRPSQGAEVLRGFYREESKPGHGASLDRALKASGFSADHVKRVWSDDYKVRPGPYDNVTTD